MTVSPPHWNVNDRVDAVMREHDKPPMTDAQVDALKTAAIAEFRAAMLDRGTDPDRFELLVHIDELVGPMAFVLETATKQDWPLPIFQVWLNRS